MKRLLLIPTCLLTVLIACSQSQKNVIPCDIALVKEMSFIPEVDAWEPCAAGECREDSLAVTAQWDTLSPMIKPYVQPGIIKTLSQWAKKQMSGYATVPELKNLAFFPIRRDTVHKKLVLEAHAAPLPSHEPVVRRTLTLYLLYDLITKKILRVTVTVRGRAEE
ncbi:MAG: hypothetical protein JW768_04730 [Chitinispirillaceae bacterium]|nr:hypothetical protein [Chitinispirillaceae bacterium]